MEVVDQAIHIGFPESAGAALIIELDGLNDGMQRTIDRVADICKQHAVVEIRTAHSAAEAAHLWLSRRAAYGALARLAPTCYIVDGCVPRTKLPEALTRTIAIGERYGLTIANMAHAGDGNLHPAILRYQRCNGVSASWRAPRHSADVCRPGGTITGEHGVGIEKQNEMPFVFSATDLAVMQRVKQVIDPDHLCNPGKIFPSPTQPKFF
jgi:glycolate oxidase